MVEAATKLCLLALEVAVVPDWKTVKFVVSHSCNQRKVGQRDLLAVRYLVRGSQMFGSQSSKDLIVEVVTH